MIGMGMGIGPDLKQSLVSRLTLSQSFGETSGDIPIYSLHRIKNIMGKRPIMIKEELERVLIEELIGQNRQYRIDSGNDWNCLTSNNLVLAINNVDERILAIINKDIGTLSKQFDKKMISELKEKLLLAKERDIGDIKKWFQENYDDLFYNMEGKIPWPIVQRLRADLTFWILEKTSPFSCDINEMVLEVARREGYIGDDPEDAWESMGGTVFTKERKRKKRRR